MPADKRPQDEFMDGRDWKFETLEHGGEYPDQMPQAIRATDANGRSCLYLPISVAGKVVDSKGFVFDSAEKARVEYSPHDVELRGGGGDAPASRETLPPSSPASGSPPSNLK